MTTPRRSFWLLLIVLAISAFYWRLAFPKQFSLLTGYESTNQAYAWNDFFAYSLQHGMLPTWDPYGHSGRTLIGEMQSGPFYPPKLLLYLTPFDRTGHLAPALYNVFYVLTAIAGAWFLFLLALEMEIEPFAAYFAAVVFACAGFVGRIVWPHLHDSAIWLPLLILLAIRAVRAPTLARALRWAALAGLALAMTILAGGLHLVIMQTLAVVALVLYFGIARREASIVQSIAIIGVIGVVSVAAGAVQLLPSMEYSTLALRYLGGPLTAPARERIPYGFLRDNFQPRALWGFFLAYPFKDGTALGTIEISPYLGLLTLLMGIAGIWRNWRVAWVRYLTVMMAASFIYTLGDWTLLHGLMYSTVPFLWMAREGGRFVYLTHFALALLAGYGVQTVFSLSTDELRHLFTTPLKIFAWILAGVAAILTVPALLGQPAGTDWGYGSFFNGCCVFALLLAMLYYGWRTRTARFLLLALVLSDVSIVNFSIADLKTMNEGDNHLKTLADSENVVRYLKSRMSPRNEKLFRAHFEADFVPSISEVYRIDTTGGMSATSLEDYNTFLYNVPRSLDMLNTCYLIRATWTKEPNYIYTDGRWKVYEAGDCFPRAWMVAKAFVEPDTTRAFKRMNFPDFDPTKAAVVADAVDMPDAFPAAIPAAITYGLRDNNHFALQVRNATRGLLVASEIYYPGWHVSLNGQEVALHKTNAILRGVVLPAGENNVVFWFRPLSVYIGGAISALCFLLVLLWWAIPTR